VGSREFIFERTGARSEVAVDPGYWTLNEARLILGLEWMSLRSMSQHIRNAGVKPEGPRRHSKTTIGRKCLTYKAEDLITVFGELEPPRSVMGP
jgi:hypothetical protein